MKLDCKECHGAVHIQLKDISGVRAVTWQAFKQPVWNPKVLKVGQSMRGKDIWKHDKNLRRCPECEAWFEVSGFLIKRIPSVFEDKP